MAAEGPTRRLSDEGPVGRYLQNILESLPSALAQLVFLSSLRDPYTGRYIHEGWASVSTPETVNGVLREAHQAVFESVVELPLLVLSKELRMHFQSVGQPEPRVSTFWLQTEPYYEMIPEGALLVSRKFFTSQFRLALELLIQAPPSWPHLEQSAGSPIPPTDLLSRPQWLN
jgi:hypothetical protein